MAAYTLPLRNRALVLFSGGLDSTVVLYWALQRYGSVAAVSFDYGQRHHVELHAAKTICFRENVPFHSHKISFFGENPLIGSKKGQNLASPSKTFIPGRNMLFLAKMAQIAAIGGFGAILAGIDGGPLNPVSYPDTHADTLFRLGDALDRGIYGEPGVTSYRFPLAGMSKAEILGEALQLPGCWKALAYTHTCFEGLIPPCGFCSGCAARIEGFFAAHLTDPLLERLKKSDLKHRTGKSLIRSGWEVKPKVAKALKTD